jgi:hypothetical protein
MKRILGCLLACTGLVGFGASACEMPSMVDVPDGNAATMDQMVGAQKRVKEYVAAMDEYLACIDDELESAGEDAPGEYRNLMTARHNAAVNEMEAVAGAFNEQVRAYKAAHPE